MAIDGFNSMIKRLSINNANVAKGTKYELITSRTFVDEGYNAPWYIERKVRNAYGPTDIDFMVQSADGTTTLLIQAKSSPGAFKEVVKEDAWINKTERFAAEQGLLPGQYEIRYVTPNKQAVPDKFHILFAERGVQWHPDIPMP